MNAKRIRNGSVKATLIIVGYAFALLVGFTVGLTTHSGWGVATSVGIVVVLVLVLTRLFRGENESDAPRRWWRVTAHPTAGYLLAIWFLLQAIGSMTAPMSVFGSARYVSGIVSLIIGAAYLNSAIRLIAINRKHVATRA